MKVSVLKDLYDDFDCLKCLVKRVWIDGEVSVLEDCIWEDSVWEEIGWDEVFDLVVSKLYYI